MGWPMTHPESVQFGPVTTGPRLYGSQRWSWIEPGLRVEDTKRVADWPCVTLRWDARSEGNELIITEDT